MIAYISGRLIEKTPIGVTIDCGGIGYYVNISLHTYSLLPDSESVMLFTYLQVREDAHTLFGFVEKSEREIFKLLLSVSGIGANTARTILSSVTPQQIIQAIAVADIETIQSVKGIGNKTAQRVILDLKDKVLKICDIADSFSNNNTGKKEEALSALEVLGFLKKSAEKVIEKIIRENPDATVEEIIKQGLKKL